MADGDPILDLSDYIYLVTGGGSGAPEAITFHIEPRVGSSAAAATVSGRLTSLWQYNRHPGASTATPSTAAALSNATTGSLLHTSPSGSKKKRLVGIGLGGASAAGTLIVYDRLCHQGGLSGTSATEQTTNLPTAALTRYTDGAGVQIWLEIFTQIGTTATTITASYTNQAGTDSRTTQQANWGATGLREAQRLVRLPLASGDTGVRAVASVTAAGTTGTAGNFGVVLAKPLLTIPIPAIGIGAAISLLREPGGPIDVGNACITFAWLANGTAAPQIHPSIAFFIEK